MTALRIATFPWHLLRLTWGLLRDPRVPRSSKIALAGAGLYWFSPIDLLPEAWFGRVGLADDGVVLLRVLRRLLADTHEHVALAHWAGQADDLVRLRAALVTADDWVGGGIRALKDAVFGARRAENGRA